MLCFRETASEPEGAHVNRFDTRLTPHTSSSSSEVKDSSTALTKACLLGKRGFEHLTILRTEDYFYKKIVVIMSFQLFSCGGMFVILYTGEPSELLILYCLMHFSATGYHSSFIHMSVLVQQSSTSHSANRAALSTEGHLLFQA